MIATGKGFMVHLSISHDPDYYKGRYTRTRKGKKRHIVKKAAVDPGMEWCFAYCGINAAWFCFEPGEVCKTCEKLYKKEK